MSPTKQTGAVPPEEPISPEEAVHKGDLFVNAPVKFILIAGMILGVLLIAKKHLHLGITSFPAGFVIAWLWWSCTVPVWRDWAADRGAAPDETQLLAERQKLVWPRGHILEKTEIHFRRNPRQRA
jgi:hypothetical protein